MIQTCIITPKHRSEIKKHESACVWFTGLSGSGKSTLASAAECELNKMGVHTFLLDGDAVRKGLNQDLGFSKQDRAENIRRIGEVTKLFTDAGIIVIAAFISPFAKDREFARSLHDKNKFIEVYVDCSLEDCEERDIKGLYKKARAGEIPEFTGISSPYEVPNKPELCIKNGNSSSLYENINSIINYLEIRGIVPEPVININAGPEKSFNFKMEN